jgi:hypothetical protein
MKGDKMTETVKSTNGPLKRLVDGGYSLPLTFFGFGLGGQILLGIPFALARASGDDQIAMVVGGVTAIIGIIYKIIVLIAVWNSADKATKTPLFWRNAAKAVAIIWVAWVLVGGFLSLR